MLQSAFLMAVFRLKVKSFFHLNLILIHNAVNSDLLVTDTSIMEKTKAITTKLDGEEFILLQSLLKLAGLCDTGGEAKQAIIGGKVTVDGVIETRRGKKIKAEQIVIFAGQKIKVEA